MTRSTKKRAAARLCHLGSALLVLGALGSGCTGGGLGTGNPDGGGDGGSGILRPQPTGCVPHVDDVSTCHPLASDYQPRVSPRTGSWPACISDDDKYHIVGMTSPGGAARANAWDLMGRLLWNNPYVPASGDFVAARNAYSTPNGIGSRVERRQDIHYPEIPGDTKTRCAEMGVPAMYPDRCVGPAKLVPLINDCFVKGINGVEPVVQAARMEAALLWFFYVSTLSEIWTCTFDSIEDCDGFWGHYNAAQARDGYAAMATYIHDVSPASHDRVFDGILAIRCWRDIDPFLPARRPDLYMQSLAQADHAELRGVALVLRDRLGRLACTTGDERRAQLEFVRVLGGFMDHAARTIDPAKADVLKAAWSAPTAASVDIAGAQAAIDALYRCP